MASTLEWPLSSLYTGRGSESPGLSYYYHKSRYLQGRKEEKNHWCYRILVLLVFKLFILTPSSINPHFFRIINNLGVLLIWPPGSCSFLKIVFFCFFFRVLSRIFLNFLRFCRCGWSCILSLLIHIIGVGSGSKSISWAKETMRKKAI